MTKFCMSVDIHDVITCATFCDDRLRGSGVARGRISRFPIDLRRRPYNTLALPCECVITPRYLQRLSRLSVHSGHSSVYPLRFMRWLQLRYDCNTTALRPFHDPRYVCVCVRVCGSGVLSGCPHTGHDVQSSPSLATR